MNAFSVLPNLEIYNKSHQNRGFNDNQSINDGRSVSDSRSIHDSRGISDGRSISDGRNVNESRSVSDGRGVSENRCLKRAFCHDYHSHRIYMLTLMKHPGIPDFSVIEGGEKDGKITAQAFPTRVGLEIRKAIKDLPIHFPEARILQFVCMPDHLHLLIEIIRRTDYHLEELVNAFTQRCSYRYSGFLLEKCGFQFNGNIFCDGFHDRILSEQNQLDILFNYIRDNPRRLYLRRCHPEYFRNALLCVASEKIFGVYGNLCLLEHPYKTVVRFSRRFSEEELSAHKRSWWETIRSGGVLVSPFIHPIEKECLQLALQHGGKIIWITNHGFTPRWKPSKSYTDPLSSGQILFVGSKEYTPAREELSRQVSLEMNRTATFISTLKKDDYRFRQYLLK